jgi:hypothetical protein
MSSLTSYYTFYLIDKFGVSVSAQMYLFLFLPPWRRHLHGRPDRRPHRPQARDLDFHPRRAPFTLALPT